MNTTTHNGDTMPHQVRAFKFTSGEEVIAEIKSYPFSSPDKQSWELRRPHILRFHPVGPNQMGLAFVPWTLSNPDLESVVVSRVNMLCDPFEISADVEKQFLQQTSGIAIAGGGSPIVK